LIASPIPQPFHDCNHFCNSKPHAAVLGSHWHPEHTKVCTFLPVLAAELLFTVAPNDIFAKLGSGKFDRAILKLLAFF
jgi:hypothetical protein